MRKNKQTTFKISVIMLLSSTIILFTLLTLFGAQSGELQIDTQPVQFTKTPSIPGIMPEDYANYFLATDSFNDAVYMENIKYLSAEDLAILSAKQIENLFDVSLKGSTTTIMFADERALYANIIKDSYAYEFSVNLVNGIINTVTDSTFKYDVFFDEKDIYNHDEINKCKQKAIETLILYFPDINKSAYDVLSAHLGKMGTVNANGETVYKQLRVFTIGVNNEPLAQFCFLEDESKLLAFNLFSENQEKIK